MNKLFDQLNNLIDKYDNFILMGHKNPDLDVLGSCLALYEIIKTNNKKPHIFLDKNNINKYNTPIVESLNRIDFNYIDENNYKQVLNNCLLIIVDLHQQERLEYPEIINNNLDTIIIDHHIMHKNYIKNNILLYNDTNLSSIIELMTYYVNYCNIKLNSIISTIMLAGIEIDTNNF